MRDLGLEYVSDCEIIKDGKEETVKEEAKGGKRYELSSFYNKNPNFIEKLIKVFNEYSTYPLFLEEKNNG
ncbi:hypothetical protein [Lentibacillus kimchii]|uniref:Uncharacterized protein n=1 Tax=Lentibacillus kimchii TaxID=1542911 RepID=A0ABW2UVZ6_9BACI